MDEIDRFLQRLQKLTTATYFPAIYEGFVEADALIQSEDSLLGLMRDYAQQLWQNRNLLSMTEEKVALFEEMLHLTPNVSQSLDDRRQAVADAVNERFVLNDAKLHEICQALAPGFTAYERTDPQALTLGIFTEEDAEDGTLPAVGIVDGIRPTVPQNLALYAGVDTSFDRPLVVNHAHFSALWAGLGVVEWHEPPEPPEPPVTGNAICGSIGADYSESVLGEVSERIERCGIAFTGLLRENVIPESGRMERGGIGFTGLLRENFIPESGVVEEYVAPSMYDVWIESVDSANNVVVALRSVFTGLTAARATTIVNNAPTYLSRYNSYLNNRGGPYTQADAVTMRDNLQSRIPAGDTSTFGIRPAST